MEYFFAYDQTGSIIRSPTEAQMEELLLSLSTGEPDDPDVALSHSSGWSLSAFPGGLLVLENALTNAVPRHMQPIPADQVLKLWIELAVGNYQNLLSLPWVAGYGR